MNFDKRKMGFERGYDDWELGMVTCPYKKDQELISAWEMGFHSAIHYGDREDRINALTEHLNNTVRITRLSRINNLFGDTDGST